MKVLLQQDLKRLGFLGDIVEVKAGYARNYLLAQGLAAVPSENNIRALADEKARRTEQRLQERERQVKAAEAVEGAEAVLTAKANPQGHLFGSVAQKEIAENLRQQGFEVTDQAIQLPHHIKQLGTTEVNLKFAEDITAKIKVTVVSQDGEETPNQQQDKQQAREQ